jgi:hypothetical protein
MLWVCAFLVTAGGIAYAVALSRRENARRNLARLSWFVTLLGFLTALAHVFALVGAFSDVPSSGDGLSIVVDRLSASFGYIALMFGFFLTAVFAKQRATRFRP